MLTISAILKLPASAEKMKGMMRHVKLKQVTHHGLYLVDPGITELEHPATVFADKVIMLPVLV